MGSIRFNLPRALVTSVAAVALAVGAAATEVAAAGPAAAKTGPVLAFTPSPADFGVVATGQTAVQTLTLANSGKSAAHGLKVGLSGPAAFTIIGDTCSGISLGAGMSCAVTVRFSPSGAGAVTATLTAASQKSGVTTTDPLTGTGALVPHLYWTNFGAFPNTGTIQEGNPDGTGVTTIVTGQNDPYGVAVGASHIYWAGDSGPSNGTIMEANLDGTGVTTLVTGLNGPQGVAVNASHIYWADDVLGGGLTGTIDEANLDGTGVTIVVPGQTQPEGVAVDGSHIYWVDTDIFAANLDGTSPHSLISGLNFGFNGVAVGPQ